MPTPANSNPLLSAVTLETQLGQAIAGLRMARWHRTLGSDGADISIRLLEFEVSDFDPDMFAATGILCPPRIARSVRKRQAEFFFGRLAARQALAATADQLGPVEIGIGNARQPLWPGGVIGSITHDHRFAAATAETGSRRNGIGIDIERIIEPDQSCSLLDTIVDKQEMGTVRAHAEAWPSTVLLTLAFSAKESLFKAAYRTVGHIFDFGAAHVISLDPVAGRLRLKLTQRLCGDFVAGQECEIGFEFLDPCTLITHFVW